MGKSGAYFWKAAMISVRSTPTTTAPLSLLANFSINSEMSTPLSCPPSIQTELSKDDSDAAAACAFVAFESFMYLIPSCSSTSSIRCEETRKLRKACRQAAGGTPKDLASAVAAAILLSKCGVKTPIPAKSSSVATSRALSARSSRNARSTKYSST